MMRIAFVVLATLLIFAAAEEEEETSTDEPSTRQINCGSSTPSFVSIGYQGRFATPHYPNYYSTGANCFWMLTTTPNARFIVTCDPFDVSCGDDTFIYSPTGDVNFLDASRPICGNRPITFNSTSNAISLSFRSSYYSRGGRFQCIAKAVEIPRPADCECGIKGQNRIVGGQPAGVTEWPWQALLADISPKGGGEHYCGATLIGQSWAITAAHCTNGRLASNIGLVVGQYDSSELKPTAQVRKLSLVVQHPSFDKRTVNNDIALLKFETPVTYTSAVRPICLPIRYANSDFDGQIAYITGWGTTSYGGETSEPLMEVGVRVLSTSKCRQYPAIASKVTDNMFCTYTEGKDACQGDSGGPLNWQDPRTGRVYLIGITSFGIGCARTDVPGVYTKITNYLGWIQQYAGVSCTV